MTEVVLSTGFLAKACADVCASRHDCPAAGRCPFDELDCSEVTQYEWEALLHEVYLAGCTPTTLTFRTLIGER